MSTDVIVVGGGVTGCGVAWDLALRGLSVTLLERGVLASGTSGRFHGLVHSGARYAVSDPVAAAQCARESGVLARIAPRIMKPTGGLFALCADDDPRYVQQWEHGIHAAGVAGREIPTAEALRREPLLAPSLRRAFLVRDAVCDGPALCAALANAARSAGAAVHDYHRVEDFLADGSGIRGVRATDARTGEPVRLEARLVVLAAGPWSNEILSHANLHLSLNLLRGAMVALDGPRLSTSVNRLQPPSDGDIALPRGKMNIAGTTSIPIDQPDDRRVEDREIELIRARIFDMLPGLKGSATRHSWSGVRPLFQFPGPSAGPVDDVHEWSRDFIVIDHAARDRLSGLVTVVGGKLTTFRLMAEKTADEVCRLLGVTASCRTETTVLP
ncbi:MAG TPA: FAD-dependent oxidoreductase [Spirochaetia bacterium]|nr:FAD-dependent oxidoreductase [Spirochaetia bacterium]